MEALKGHAMRIKNSSDGGLKFIFPGSKVREAIALFRGGYQTWTVVIMKYCSRPRTNLQQNVEIDS